MDVTGVLACVIFVNGFPASCVVDTGSAVSLTENCFAVKHKIQFAKVLGRRISVVSGECFSIAEVCRLYVRILGYTATGQCGVIDDFSYDFLLGLDFITVAPLMIDLKRRILYYCEAPLILENGYEVLSPRFLSEFWSPNKTEGLVIEKIDMAQPVPYRWNRQIFTLRRVGERSHVTQVGLVDK